MAEKLPQLDDGNDYMLDSSCFTKLGKFWGPHEVEGFASDLTKQLDVKVLMPLL